MRSYERGIVDKSLYIYYVTRQGSEFCYEKYKESQLRNWKTTFRVFREIFRKSNTEFFHIKIFKIPPSIIFSYAAESTTKAMKVFWQGVKKGRPKNSSCWKTSFMNGPIYVIHISSFIFFHYYMLLRTNNM